MQGDGSPLHHTIQYNTTQHNTIQYNIQSREMGAPPTTQCNSIQHTMQEDGSPLHQTIQHSTTYNAGGWGPLPPYNTVRWNMQCGRMVAPSTIQYNLIYHPIQEGRGPCTIQYNLMQHAMQNGGAMRNAMQGDAGALQHKIQHNTTYNTGGWGPFHHTIQYNTIQYNTIQCNI